MVEEAINHFHELLAGPFADDAQQRLDSATERYQLRFGTRAVCNVLRPFFIEQSHYEEVMCESRLVLRAIRKLGRRLLADSQLRSQLNLSPDEERLIGIEPGYSDADSIGRLDAFLDAAGGFRFVEYNAESPGGLLYGDCLSEAFLEMDVVREFAKTYPVNRIPIRPRILAALLDCYRQWGGRNHPQIGIVDWRDVSTKAEFEVCREYFEEQSFRTGIFDPEELELRGGHLWCGDFRIDIVYKRVVIGELLERCGGRHLLIRAAEERAACVVNSFRVQMLFKKSLFALLDDPQTATLFDASEVRAIAEHVPWTRLLREGTTIYNNQRVDLLDFVSRSRELLVLKPSGEYGGRGVTLGWECDDERWQQAIKDALDASFVVQERVELREEVFPRLLNGRLELARHFVDFDPYSWPRDEVAGAGVRLSSSALLNVTSGGGSAAPLLVINQP